MNTITVRKPAHRKKPIQINFRADAETIQMIEDLKTMHPGWGKSRVIHEAIKRMHNFDSR